MSQLYRMRYNASGVTQTGTTTHTFPAYDGKLQVTAEAVSATGTLTVTARPWGKTSFDTVTGGTLDLTSDQGFILEGHFDALKFTASNGADTYTVQISSLDGDEPH